MAKFVKDKLHWFISIVFFTFVAGYSATALAGVVLNGTRIILGSGERNVSTVVSNVTGKNYAVQVWINDQADSDDALIPFIAMPALFRVRAGEEQVVRIIKTPGVLPEDRESIFYFNAQEIPLAQENDNSLKLAIRTRVKFFYRPESLPIKSSVAPSLLQWKLVGQGPGAVLRVINQSPFYITFAGANMIVDGKTIQLTDIDMLAPYSTTNHSVKLGPKSTTATIEYSIINDHGGYSEVFKVKAQL